LLAGHVYFGRHQPISWISRMLIKRETVADCFRISRKTGQIREFLPIERKL